MTDHLPLDGVRIIEICNVAAGPFCGMLLADMGADVIKLEHPEGGDTLRAWPPLSDGFSENFAALNRNKRSVTLNLKVAADRDVARALMSEADVVIENNRPGVMDRLGLGYAALKEINPDYLMPAHCVGEPFYDMVRREMPGKVFQSNVGTRYTFIA